MDREEIRARLRAADALDPADGGSGGAEYVEAMRVLVPHAEALGDPELLFTVRLSFTWALRGKPLRTGPSDFFREALPILRRCLLAWHAEPHRFPEGDVRAMWNQLFLVVDAYVWLYPEPAHRIHRLLDELDRYCPPTRVWTRYAIDHYRMFVDARRGDVEAVEKRWHLLRAQGDPQEHLHLDGKASHEALMWQRLGRNDRAIEVLAPLAAGQIPTRAGKEYADDLIMPYLRAGRFDEAVAAHQRTYARPGMKLEDVAGHLEFCARTGNEERGIEVLQRNVHYFEKDVASVEAMWTAAAAALLCRQVLAKDLDREWIWPCGCDDPRCDALPAWSYADLGSLLRWEVVTFAEKVDELNATAFQGGKMRELLSSSPIVDALPLPPDTAPPKRRAAPPTAAHLPLTTAAEILDALRAREAPDGAVGNAAEREVRVQHLLQNALAIGDPELATEIRLALLDHLAARPRSRPHRLFTTLAELSRRPALLDAGGLDRMWAAVPATLDRVLTRPAVHLAQIEGLLRRLEPHCCPDSEDLHHLRWFGVEVAVRRGDADAAGAAWAAFTTMPATATYSTAANDLRRTLWWLDLGRDGDAIASLGDNERADYLLLPYLRTGRAGEARAVHERTWQTAAAAPEVAAHLDYCARTGELGHGRELIQRNLDLFCTWPNDSQCSIDRVRAYGAVTRLSERLVAAGRDERWTWPGDGNYPPEEGWSYARLAEDCRSETELFAARWDELTATTATRTLVAGFG